MAVVQVNGCDDAGVSLYWARGHILSAFESFIALVLVQEIQKTLYWLLTLLLFVLFFPVLHRPQEAILSDR